MYCFLCFFFLFKHIYDIIACFFLFLFCRGLALLILIPELSGLRGLAHVGILAAELGHLGDSRNTVRGYRLDIPRFEQSLND